jgi:hypothetical protein
MIPNIGNIKRSNKFYPCRDLRQAEIERTIFRHVATIQSSKNVDEDRGGTRNAFDAVRWWWRAAWCWVRGYDVWRQSVITQYRRHQVNLRLCNQRLRSNDATAKYCVDKAHGRQL